MEELAELGVVGVADGPFDLAAEVGGEHQDHRSEERDHDQGRDRGEGAARGGQFHWASPFSASASPDMAMTSGAAFFASTRTLTTLRSTEKETVAGMLSQRRAAGVAAASVSVRERTPGLADQVT